MSRLFFVLFCIAGVFSDVQAGWRDRLPGFSRKSTLLLTDDVEMDPAGVFSIPCATSTDVSTTEACVDEAADQVVGVPEANCLLEDSEEETVFVGGSRDARAEISGVRSCCSEFWRAHKGKILVGSVIVGTVTAGAIALTWQASAGDQSDDSPFDTMNATEAPNTTWTMAHEFTTAQPAECTEEFISQQLPQQPFSCQNYWLTPQEVTQLFFEKTYCGAHDMLDRLGRTYYFMEVIIRGVCRRSRVCVSTSETLSISHECAAEVWEEVQEIECPGQEINHSLGKENHVRHILKDVQQGSTGLLHAFGEIYDWTRCRYT